jgi:hypothetical protein
MNLQRIIVLTIAVFLPPMILLANDPCLNDLKHFALDIGTSDNHGHLVNAFHTTGWEMNFEEDDDVHFSYVVTNDGPKQVRVIHCKPFTYGPWQIIENFPAVGKISDHALNPAPGWRADNDSNYFVVEIETTPGTFVPMDSNAPNSSATLNPQHTIAHMEWHNPQRVVLEVRAKDTRH